MHSGYICIVSMTTVKKSKQDAVNAEMSSCTLIQVNSFFIELDFNVPVTLSFM